MLHVNIPTREEIVSLSEIRSDICLSIYMKTSPMGQGAQASRIEMDNLLKETRQQLQSANVEKNRIDGLMNQVNGIMDEEDFWQLQANSVAILATPSNIRYYRLANNLNTQLHISDRFSLKPLLRALTFSQTAYILALSENSIRVIEFFGEGEPKEIHVPDMPKSAQKPAQYARRVDEALRPLLIQSPAPLILAAAEPMASIYRSVSSIGNLLDETVSISPDRINKNDLVAQARPVLDRYNAKRLNETKMMFEAKKSQGQVATDLSDVAKSATFGRVGILMVDFDKIVTGQIDESGNIQFFDATNAYDVIDEIVKRAIASGAQIIAVRKSDMIGDTGIAAVLRYSLSL